MENLERSDNCPVAPPPRVTIHSRVLHRACQVCGGVEQLAARLRVPTVSLLRWLNGVGEPPTAVFLRAVDIIMPAWTDEDESRARALLDRGAKKPD